MFGQFINRVGKIADFGHKYGKGFGKRVAHPYQIFLGVPPLPPGADTQPQDISSSLTAR